MRDIHQGTTPPHIEARFKNIIDALARLEKGTTTNIRTVVKSTDVVTSDLAEHLASADPHGQYLLESVAANLYAPIGTSFMVPSKITSALTIPVDRQLIVFKNLEISSVATLTAEGDVVIL